MIDREELERIGYHVQQHPAGWGMYAPSVYEGSHCIAEAATADEMWGDAAEHLSRLRRKFGREAPASKPDAKVLAAVLDELASEGCFILVEDTYPLAECILRMLAAPQDTREAPASTGEATNE